MIDQEQIMIKIAQSVIANQLALNFNEELKGTKFYKQDLKFALNKLNPILIKAEISEYDKMFDKKENDVVQLYSVVENITNDLANLGIEHYNNIRHILDAYRKDPKSIQGIINKINS